MSCFFTEAARFFCALQEREEVPLIEHECRTDLIRLSYVALNAEARSEGGSPRSRFELAVGELN